MDRRVGPNKLLLLAQKQDRTLNELYSLIMIFID